MRQTAKVEGTKIAQAAKDLNVTSVTIRRYITEFNIETTSDENGIKVLPDEAMDELQEIRKLKEDGLTNPQVLEKLEDMRNQDKKPAAKAKPKARVVKAKVEPEVVEEEEEEKPAAKAKDAKRPTAKRITKVKEAAPEEKEPEEEEVAEAERPSVDPDSDQDGEGDAEGESGDGKPKHSLTCQTCGKVFEHMNPRLRDCLDCYRAKRKERRRGGAERHKNVIQHPLAQQAASRQAAQTGAVEVPAAYAEDAPVRAPQRETRDRIDRPDRPQRTERPERVDRPERIERSERTERPERGDRPDRPERNDRYERDRGDREAPAAAAAIYTPAAQSQVVAQGLQRTVRNYRKAIEETRNITGSLKRRLERPDLPEGERRWLEQIYAYQLILHQGWRHLAEYKAATQQQGKTGAGAGIDD